MYTKILVTAAAAAFVFGSIAASSARDYDDYSRGAPSFEDATPLPSPQYRQAHGHNARAQAMTGRENAVVPATGVVGQTFPGQW